MSLWLLVKKEIWHKKLFFFTGLFSLAVATAGLVAGLTLLRAHDLATEQTLIGTERELRSEMTQLEDRYRRIMRDMGHNVLILNRAQDMHELRSRGHPNTYLDYEDVWKLAHGEVTTINHMLPILQERIEWREKGTEAMISGISGQVPVFTKPEFLTDSGEYRSPITRRVPDGRADLGAAVAITHNFRVGDTFTLNGHELTVNRIYPQRGTADDVVMFIPLDLAQEILGRPGQINGILALECVCDLDALGDLHREIEAELPHAKVFEYSSLIVARMGVRHRAEEAHRRVVQSIMTQRESLRGEMERMAGVVVPLLLAGAGIWIFVLIFGNMRERRYEIGVLRAVGYSRSAVLRIFLLKALIMGIGGGVLGCLLGLWVGIGWGGVDWSLVQMRQLIDAPLLVAGLLLSPLLSIVAAMIPAVMAANLDPAVILREE